MILSFSTKINNKETYFPEKILAGLLIELETNESWNYLDVPDFIYDYGEFVGYNSADEVLEAVEKCVPKITTIREDKSHRWRSGVNIDFFINTRQKDMFSFAPVLPVLSTQKIEITHSLIKKRKHITVFIDDKPFYIQGFSLEQNIKMLKLAQNDGFDSIEDFFDYFNENCIKKIIHWTDLKY